MIYFVDMNNVLMHRNLFLVFILVFVTVSCKNKETVEASYVNDWAHLLTEEQEDKLTEKIIELESSIGPQIAIITIDSLPGESIEEYSLRMANTLKIGREEYADGILITVAFLNRKIRIEVGYGLEKIIMDEIAARIIREDVAPQFRSENYYEGLSNAVSRITKLIKENKDLVGQRP